MAAVRETREELGIAIDAPRLTLFNQVVRRAHAHVDVWLVDHWNELLDRYSFGSEVSDTRWASSDTIVTMVAAGTFCDFGGDYLRALGIG